MSVPRRRVITRSVTALTHTSGCGRVLGEEEVILYSDGLTERYIKLKCRQCKEYDRFMV